MGDATALSEALEAAGSGTSLLLLQSLRGFFVNLREIGIWGRSYLESYGRPGLDHFHWIALCLLGRVARIGRLEYERSPFPFSPVAGIGRGDQVVRVHVPQDGPLLPSAVDLSLMEARCRFPSLPFVCDSWLLDPILRRLLPPRSNIISFQSRFENLFPVPSEVPQIYERVFSFATRTREEALAFHPATSLQRSVQRALRQGAVFTNTGGVLVWPRSC